MSTLASPPRIKGYLPVRMRLPATWGKPEEFDTTFFYIREHRQKETTSDSTSTIKPGTTLFVANVPGVPGISPKILLHSIFGRFAKVARVTVVPNPRGGTQESNPATSPLIITNSCAVQWTDHSFYFHPSFLPPILAAKAGKYAHVVFESPKELKKATRALEEIMMASSNNSLDFDGIEIQTLSDESMHQWEEKRRKLMMGSKDRDDDDDLSDAGQTDKAKKEPLTGVLAVAQRYRESLKLITHDRLMQECNRVMEEYEAAEEAKRRATEAVKSQPDKDGFVTVSFSNAVGSKVELEQSVTATTPSRRKGHKRSRSSTKRSGNQPLPDFYKFQRQEHRQQTMNDLRQQFEEDLKRVKRLKEEKQYRPF